MERFGRFARVYRAGFKFKIPFIERIVKRQSLRVQALPVVVDTITKNKVPLKVTVVIQHFIREESGRNGGIFKSYYVLENFASQASSFVFDVVRARVPELDLDEVFLKKDDLAATIKQHLGPKLQQFGYEIEATQVTQIDPDERVMKAMADINVAERERDAATAWGERDRIRSQKHGEGVGDMRAAVVERVITALGKMRGQDLSDAEKKEIYELVALQMVVDAIEKVGSSQNAKVVFIPMPSASGLMGSSELRQAYMEANEALGGGGKKAG